MSTEEIRSLAERVKELRQQLESVEAHLRELSGDRALEPLETVDSPTVLTTNHAQRRARYDRLVPWLAALAATVVLGAGIALGHALGAAAPTPRPTAPAVVTATAPPNTPPSPPPASTASAAQGPVTEAPAATVIAVSAPPTPSASATAGVIAPSAMATVAAPMLTNAPRKNVDRGF